MPVLDNPKHERFAQLVAKGGKTLTACYLEAYGGDYDSARASGARLFADASIAERVSEIQEKAAARIEWSLAERLKFCRDIVETPIGSVDESSPLCQAAEYGKDGRKIKMPDKLKAVELYTKIAGDGAAEKSEVTITPLDMLALKLRNGGD